MHRPIRIAGGPTTGSTRRSLAPRRLRAKGRATRAGLGVRYEDMNWAMR